MCVKVLEHPIAFSIQEFLAAWHVSCHRDLIDMSLSEIWRPYLKAFGLFSAGLIGCDKFEVHIYHDKNYVFKCFYETQNSRNLDFLYKLSKSYHYPLNLDNPLDMYVFGYALVHAPIQWRLTASTSFDVLASCLADHAHSDGKILGGIQKVHLYAKLNGNFPHIEVLPKSLLQSVEEISVGVLNSSIPASLKGIVALHNLEKVYFDFNESCQDDYLLYRTLSSFFLLKEFELHLYHMSAKGMQELSTVIASNHTLESVIIKYYRGMRFQKYNNFCALIEAILMCSTLKSVTLDSVPFCGLNSSISNNLKVEHLKFIFL